MDDIVPRWEWRTFGTHLPPADDVFEGVAPVDIDDSDEVYLLAAGDLNVKIRDGHVDIKALREVDEHGLEQWMPIARIGFPMAPDDAASALHALGVDEPHPDRDPYDESRFVAEVGDRLDHVRTVPVHKHRVRYEIAGCTAEHTDVDVGGTRTTTIAVEAEDADAVVRAVGVLGLSAYRNTAYPEGLRATLDHVPLRVAVLDIGTNSVKFHLAQRRRDGTWETILDRSAVTRLGEGLGGGGGISDAAAARTADAIADMVAEAAAQDVRAISAVGTAGLRMADNSDDVIATIRRHARVTIEVLPASEEARLAYLAAVEGVDVDEGQLVVFDTGGGSTEFTFGHGTDVDDQFSVDVGAAGYTERFGLDASAPTDTVDRASEAISADLSALDGRPTPDALIAIGGAVTTMAAVYHELREYDADVVQGTELTRGELDRQIDRYASRDADARRSIVGLQPERAEVILAGACIVRTVMDKLDRDSLTVSDRGLRHGILRERFG